MQRFDPWRLTASEEKELHRLLREQAMNEWYFKASETYAPGPVPSLLFAGKSGSGGGAALAVKRKSRGGGGAVSKSNCPKISLVRVPLNAGGYSYGKWGKY